MYSLIRWAIEDIMEKSGFISTVLRPKWEKWTQTGKVWEIVVMVLNAASDSLQPERTHPWSFVLQ
jgi:hypothetical protein